MANYDHFIQEQEAARVKLLERCTIPVGNALINDFNRLRWKRGGLEDVLDEYRRCRDEVKLLMGTHRVKSVIPPHRDGPPAHEILIDRHKISASFLMAIVRVGPLHLHNDGKVSLEGELLANEILAFRTALRILGVFARMDVRVGITKVNLMETVVYPVPSDGKSTYLHHAYRAIRHANKKGKLSLPVLANWMFYIQKYCEQIKIGEFNKHP